ncbi:hypothetical protein PHLCEN_2v5249 [Hermanssonia centrifuga]|uniref:Uncharacterized protein n=1 Tax=Hermanssonia centrifuga TaxID=98765 RepID=A0A2R6P8R1_9APHY|nr:hypothetical protein PHLCEN_2v5249 [Hermanssonia centrifuga]
MDLYGESDTVKKGVELFIREIVRCDSNTTDLRAPGAFVTMSRTGWMMLGSERKASVATHRAISTKGMGDMRRVVV